MVSAGNDDDLMSQVFASVQLPEVKWTTESHETHEVVHKTVTVDHNGERHIHEEHYHHEVNGNGHHHDSDSEHDHVEHSDDHGYQHGKSDVKRVSEVFFHRPAVETFRVENGIPDSDAASERSSHRNFRMSESDRESHHGLHHHDDDHAHENGHSIVDRVFDAVPHKSQQQDSVIAELKRHQEIEDSSSDDETLVGDDEDHHHSHQDAMWHHEPHEEEHVVHYDMPPTEPARDYESARHSIAHSEPHEFHQPAAHETYFSHTASFGQHETDAHSQRSNSVHSHASHHSHQSHHSHHSAAHAPPSHHSSTHSIPPPVPAYSPPRSRASSTSTLGRDVQIVTDHVPQQFPKHIYHNGHEIDEETHHVNPKGIHTYREYGTAGARGHRRSDASERSSLGYNRESFTVGDIEYIREKPKAPARERTATKQSTFSSHQTHQDRYRSDTKQSAVSHRSDVQLRAPPKQLNLTKAAPAAPFVPNIDDSPIAPVSNLLSQYGGRGHGNRQHIFPAKVEKHEEVHHHSRTSSKRGSDVSSVHSLKPIANKTGRSNTQHSVASQASRVSHASHKNRRDSTNSVATQHTGVIDKTPGKYDSIRVVKNVRTYKQFLDVWSQREIEDALEEGPIHSEPIPRPRYSISARHVYPEIQSLKAPQHKHRPSLRPSEKLNEYALPGKVDKATSYHNLSVIGTGVEKRHSSIAPIHEEEEDHHEVHHHHHTNGVDAVPPRSRNSTLKSHHSHHSAEHHEHHDHHETDEDEFDVDIKTLRSVFEPHGGAISRSRRSSVQSNATTKSHGIIPIVPASHRQPDKAIYQRRRR